MNSTSKKERETDKKMNKNNDIKDLRHVKQLDKVNLDFDSPRLKKAMNDLGVGFDECQKK